MDTHNGNADWSKRDQLAGPLSLVQQDSGSATQLQHALELNLARAMAQNSDSHEALGKYRVLQNKGDCLLTSHRLGETFSMPAFTHQAMSFAVLNAYSFWSSVSQSLSFFGTSPVAPATQHSRPLLCCPLCQAHQLLSTS